VEVREVEQSTWFAQAELLKLQKSGQFPDEPCLRVTGSILEIQKKKNLVSFFVLLEEI
jgi:hypothetical protein